MPQMFTLQTSLMKASTNRGQKSRKLISGERAGRGTGERWINNRARNKRDMDKQQGKELERDG